jgi:hypothetical protein
MEWFSYAFYAGIVVILVHVFREVWHEWRSNDDDLDYPDFGGKR